MKEVESELGGMRRDWADRSERADSKESSWMIGMNEKGGHDHRAEPCVEAGWVDNASKWDRSLLSTSLSP